MQRKAFRLGVLVSALVLAACSSDYDPVAVLTQQALLQVAVAPGAVSLSEGETASLSVAVTDRSGRELDVPVVWRSQNSRVAAVSATGEILALSQGEAFIYAAHGRQRDSAQVVVTPGQPASDPEPEAEDDDEDADGDSDAEDGDSDDAGTSDPPTDRSEPAADYPNEPRGLRLIAHSPMSEMFEWGPTELRSGTGSWWQWREGDPDSSIRRETGIPGGPHFNRTRYPRGLEPGSAPVNWGAWNSGSTQSGDEYERIYFSQRVRFVDSGRGNWEGHPVGTKLGFFGVGRCSGSNAEVYLFLEGGTRSSFTIRAMQQGPVSRGMSQNRQTRAAIHVGRWHHWEIEMVLNDIGRSNGILRWWIDGTLIMEHRNVVYRTAQDPCGFMAYKWNPTWGGMGGGPRSRDDFIDISDIRISGKHLR